MTPVLGFFLAEFCNEFNVSVVAAVVVPFVFPEAGAAIPPLLYAFDFED